MRSFVKPQIFLPFLCLFPRHSVLCWPVFRRYRNHPVTTFYPCRFVDRAPYTTFAIRRGKTSLRSLPSTKTIPLTRIKGSLGASPTGTVIRKFIYLQHCLLFKTFIAHRSASNQLLQNRSFRYKPLLQIFP